jgi:ABC-type multidrug transport system fused ATPase/permease subunit
MIWQCLETVQLDSLVQRLFKQQTVESTGKDTSALELQIHDGGLNLSVGQRQLVCFARTMLSKPDILLLDEATSSCDGATDEVIQTALRKEFDCTMLIIAHRLQTIMDVDKILVLDDGKCVEFGTPEELLKDKDSFFSQLVQSSESISNDD